MIHNIILFLIFLFIAALLGTVFVLAFVVLLAIFK